MDEFVDLLFRLNRLKGPLSLVPHKFPGQAGTLHIVTSAQGDTSILLSADSGEDLYHSLKAKVEESELDERRRWARAEAERSRAERYGYDTETCLANAAECGGL